MSLSLLELRGLGDELPARWRLLVTQRPELELVEPLLFRDPVMATRLGGLFRSRFLLPDTMLMTQGMLVVIPWDSQEGRGQPEERLMLHISLLDHFRLFRQIPGIRVPVALPEPFVPPEVARTTRPSWLEEELNAE